MGLFSSLLGGKKVDSSAAANQYLNQIPGKARTNLSPYIMPGQEAQGFVDKIMAGYKPSEGYQFQKQELGNELGNNAAAGGFAGTEYDQGQRGKLIQALLSGDMQQYFNNVNGVHNQSFNASRELNDIETGALNQQGGLAFNAAEQKNQRRSSLRNALLKLGGGAIGGFLGGPAGSSIGSQLGGAFGGGGGGGGSGSYGQQSSFGGGNPGTPGYGF